MILGNPIEGTITCRDQAGALFDPDVVEVSFLKGGTTVEETLTYGGTAAHDSQLTRTSVGVYSFWYTTDVAGIWMVLPRWKQDTDNPADPILVTPLSSTRVVVSATSHQFTDRPAPTP